MIIFQLILTYAQIAQQQYVIKHIKNDESHISLFNELIGYKLADKFGLKSPNFGHCYYEENITNINKGLIIDNLENGDIFTYTTFLDGAIPLMDIGKLHEFTNEEILRLIVFDCMICNTDRNSGNILMKPISKNQKNTESKTFELIPIDYTHIFPDSVNWTISLVRKNKTRDYPSVRNIIEGNYYQLLLQNRIYTKEMMTKEKLRVIKILENINLKDYFKEIPEEIISKVNQDELELLIDFFNYRKEEFESIYSDLNNEFERRGII